MKASLHLQNPGVDERYAIDVIGDAAQGASHGVALFAFATVSGVELLLEHPAIQHLSATGIFELIVGIDAITNRETLEHLLKAAERRKGLRPRVFWNSTDGLFHPKLCWFRNRRRDVIIVGSGNLTPRGLRDNFEAFAMLVGNSGALRSLTTDLEAFLESHRANIREIDGHALARASKNTFAKAVAVIEPPPTLRQPRRHRNSVAGSMTLVAELPRGGSRWQQANFDYETARDFFEVEPYSDSLAADLLLNEVDPSGASISQETRRFTFTQSKNLRLHLGAHRGKAYPTSGRPIAVFRRVKPRHFIYQVLLPGNVGFQALKALLSSQSASGIRRMITTGAALRKAWAACPLC
jgi:hypothetical protein